MNEIRMGMLENLRVFFYYPYLPETDRPPPPPPPKKKRGGGIRKNSTVKTNDILHTSH